MFTKPKPAGSDGEGAPSASHSEEAPPNREAAATASQPDPALRNREAVPSRPESGKVERPRQESSGLSEAERARRAREDWERNELCRFVQRQPESKPHYETLSRLPVKRLYTPEDAVRFE